MKKEFKSLDKVGLQKVLKEKEEEILGLNFKLVNNGLQNYRIIRKTKKDIARVKTALREME
ncbi:50S ribosomal protein L29 [bacterium]|jgi:ribosomal protein L29|nr:50S ribosomal protein L29 [bacterium]MBT3581167.1 50S ribosomal protein L29 [bacterium]MBT4551600.1 50S ribosomal protein L29 [bacterium]